MNDNGYVFETADDAEKFVQLLAEYANKSHLWCNGGYSPEELSRLHGRTMPKTISFGLGIKKAIADGDIDRDELIREIQKMGIDVIE